MGYHFTTIGLGPVLLAQGHYVRRVTPRLPEPEGLRQGVEGSGPPLRLLILGDSSAAGVGVATQAEAARARRRVSRVVEARRHQRPDQCGSPGAA